MGFRQKLAKRQKEVNSLVCVGLDPLPHKLPECIHTNWERANWTVFAQWMCDIVDATASCASMFKPQRAHYEAFPQGREMLQFIVNHIHVKHPDIPVFLDCKRGDIGRTQERYRIAHFEIDGVDGMNFNGYMGKDTIEALVDQNHPGRALVGLGRTSNPSAWHIQDRPGPDGTPNWEFMVESLLAWATELGVIEDAGIVMGAAHKKGLLASCIHHPDVDEEDDSVYSYPIKRVREIVGDSMWLLHPGAGKQMGAVLETIQGSYMGPGTTAINSSSGIDFASQGEDYAEAAAKKAKELRDQIREAGGNVN